MTNDDQIRIYLSCGQNYLVRWFAVLEFAGCCASSTSQALHSLVKNGLDYERSIVGDGGHCLHNKHVLGRVYDRKKMNRRATHQRQLLRLSQSFTAIRRSVEGQENLVVHEISPLLKHLAPALDALGRATPAAPVSAGSRPPKQCSLMVAADAKNVLKQLYSASGSMAAAANGYQHWPQACFIDNPKA
jgi:hypothetical protein